MKKILASLAIIITLCGATFGGMNRAEALTISPSRIEITGNPGDTLDLKFILANEQEDTKTFYTDSENFEASGETGTPSFLPGNDGLASWIKVPPQIILQKGEQQKIPFTITIPKEAEPGGHFAAIFLSTIPPTAAGGQVAVGAKIGILILLRVSGDIKEGGGILNFSTSDKKKVYTSLPIDFIYRFQNSGADRINPQGEIKVKDLIGLTKITLPANKGEGNVLPGSIRRYTVTWGTHTEDKTGLKDQETKSFFGSVIYELTHFAVGSYTAHLHLTYGSNNQITDKSYTVFVFPWQFLLVAVIILLVVGFILRIIIRRYNRYIINKARGQ